MMVISGLKREAGTTLIVCLFLLLIVTVIGLASVRTSNLEIKMTASVRDKAIAFEAAEAALKRIEQNLISNAPERKHMLPDCDSTVSGSQCFSEDCQDGRCFQGALLGNKCVLFSPALTENKKHVDMWRQKNVWEDAQYHSTITLSEAINTNVKERISAKTVKYVVEFLCMVPKIENDTSEAKIVVNSGSNTTDGTVPLYRITALATGDAGRASVMLQSVFKTATF